MTDIKRYDLRMTIVNPSLTQHENPQGDWIKASDIPLIKAQAVRDAVHATGMANLFTDSCPQKDISKVFEDYADKIEAGEI